MVPVPVMVPPNLFIVPKLLKVPKVFIFDMLRFMVAPRIFVVVAPELFVKFPPFKSSVSSLVKVLPELLVIPTPDRLYVPLLVTAPSLEIAPALPLLPFKIKV